MTARVKQSLRVARVMLPRRQPRLPSPWRMVARLHARLHASTIKAGATNQPYEKMDVSLLHHADIITSL